MHKSKVLLVDAAINFGLGLLLILFNPNLVHSLGVPPTDQRFYPSILGAIFIGITLALLLEYLRGPQGPTGLGLGGAVCINLCGGLMLAVWLLSGQLRLPTHGVIFLWVLVVALVVVSSVELALDLMKHRSMPPSS